MLYALQPVGGGPIKIGTSGNVKKRHEHLQSYYGCELVLLWTAEGGRYEEGVLHEQLASYRIRRTEQFIPCREVVEFLGLPSNTVIANEADELMPRLDLASVRMSSDVLRYARTVSAWRNVTLVDWLNDVVRKAAEAELAQIPKSK